MTEPSDSLMSPPLSGVGVGSGSGVAYDCCEVTLMLCVVLAQISPEGLVLFIAAVILVALGVAVLRTL